MKRLIVAGLGLLLLIGTTGYVLRGPLIDAVVAQRSAATLTRVDRSTLTDGQLHVWLCGTAAALPDPDRAGPCTAIVAGGQFVLIDAGPGSWRVVDGLNLPVAALSAVLITHLHSDHIGELGEAIQQSWIAGRSEPLPVYGPPGIDHVVNGFAQAYGADVGYRVTHHDDAYMPHAAAAASANVLPLPVGTDRSPVFERDGLSVSVFRVDHAPVDVAYGYRIEYRGRVVVVSGDTKPSASVRRNAQGADLLLHEALDTRLTERASEQATSLGMSRVAKLALDVGNYHTTPIQAAQIAADAGVQKLVLTHVFPPLPNAVARRLFMAGTAEMFAGERVLGEDGMRFDLAPLR